MYWQNIRKTATLFTERLESKQPRWIYLQNIRKTATLFTDRPLSEQPSWLISSSRYCNLEKNAANKKNVHNWTSSKDQSSKSNTTTRKLKSANIFIHCPKVSGLRELPLVQANSYAKNCVLEGQSALYTTGTTRSPPPRRRWAPTELTAQYR